MPYKRGTNCPGYALLLSSPFYIASRNLNVRGLNVETDRISSCLDSSDRGTTSSYKRIEHRVSGKRKHLDKSLSK